MAALDSKAVAFVIFKAKAEAALLKMWSLLQKVDNSLDFNQWQFFPNHLVTSHCKQIVGTVVYLLASMQGVRSPMKASHHAFRST